MLVMAGSRLPPRKQVVFSHLTAELLFPPDQPFSHGKKKHTLVFKMLSSLLLRTPSLGDLLRLVSGGVSQPMFRFHMARLCIVTCCFPTLAACA